MPRAIFARQPSMRGGTKFRHGARRVKAHHGANECGKRRVLKQGVGNRPHHRTKPICAANTPNQAGSQRNFSARGKFLRLKLRLHFGNINVAWTLALTGLAGQAQIQRGFGFCITPSLAWRADVTIVHQLPRQRQTKRVATAARAMSLIQRGSV